MGATMSAFIPSYTKSPITSKIFSLELFSKASSDYQENYKQNRSETKEGKIAKL